MNRIRQEKSTATRKTILQISIILAGVLMLVFAGCELVNNAPSISIQVEDETPVTGSTQTFTAVVDDLDEDVVSVTWSATEGDFNKTSGETVKWTAPGVPGKVLITAIADDRKIHGTDTATVRLTVINDAPTISKFTSSAPYVTLGNSVTLSCEAYDLNGEDITYLFRCVPSFGTIVHESPEASTADWIAPSDPNYARTYNLIVEVSDSLYDSADTTQVLVFSEHESIWVVDKARGEVSKFTSKGEKIFSSSYTFQKPVAVASYTGDFYGCYVADQDAGQIVELDEEGKTVTTFPNLPNIKDLAIHHYTNTLWAISVSDDEPRLSVINTITGSVIKQAKGLRHPTAIAINQNRGEVWITDYSYEENDRVVQISIRDFLSDLPDSLTSLNMTTFGEGYLNGPSSLAVRNAQNANVYIADTYNDLIQIIRYSGGNYNSTLETVSLGQGTKPHKVAVADDGRVWVLGLDGSVQYFSEATPSVVTQIPEEWYQFANPHAIAADEETAWIGDNGRNQVVKINVAEELATPIDGFSFVEDIVINN